MHKNFSDSDPLPLNEAICNGLETTAASYINDSQTLLRH